MKHFIKIFFIGIILDFLLILSDKEHMIFFQKIGLFFYSGSALVFAEAFGQLIGILIFGVILYLPLYFLFFRKKAQEKNTIDTNSTTKTDFKHSKERLEINGFDDSYFSELKSNYSNANFLNEDEIYEKVMTEIEEDKRVKSTWAKALSQSDGDKNKAESIYINLRVEFLKKENSSKVEIKIDNLEDDSQEEKRLFEFYEMARKFLKYESKDKITKNELQKELKLSNNDLIKVLDILILNEVLIKNADYYYVITSKYDDYSKIKL